MCIRDRISPTRLPTATNVPAVSKKSTNRKENSAMNAWNGSANNSPKPEAKAPKPSSFRLVSNMLDGKAGIPSIPQAPQMIPTIAVMTIPTKTAAGTFFTTKAIVSKIPKIANKTEGVEKFPKVTKAVSYTHLDVYKRQGLQKQVSFGEF